jgi:diguanylate cyclase (GGDEF)-like protein
MAKLVKISDEREKKQQEEESKLAKKQVEIKNLKKEIKKLKQQVETLNLSLDTIHGRYLESALVSVDLLEDLEYQKYKSSFIDIGIKVLSDYQKLKKYRSLIKNFFHKELKCCYIKVSYSGRNKKIKDELTLKSSKKQQNMPDSIGRYCKLYSVEMVDVMFPKRIIGRIIIGREPYKDRKKEKDYEKKIRDEIHFTQRVIENTISEIHNKELAVKDPLTGLYNRKFLEEKLRDEFNSIDMMPALSKIERDVLDIIIKTDGSSYNIIRDQYMFKHKKKDEEFFNQAIESLRGKNFISSRKDMYLGEKIDYFTFENSKKEYSLFVALFDLDHFKDINDNWGGHEVGDRILIEFAAIMKKHIRTTDIVVRQGGEEFLIIFSRANSIMKIKEILEKIRMECENNLLVKFRGKERNVTVSIGLTRISRYDVNFNQMINRADAALYTAKNIRNKLIIFEQGPDDYTRSHL